VTRRDVIVVEVGPRDGLQNEQAVVPVDARVAFISALAAAGVPAIECGAFVRPDRVPQMADSEEVCRRAGTDPAVVAHGVRLSALVPNPRGLARALAAEVDEVGLFVAASETFNRRNVNQSIEASLAGCQDVCSQAREAGLRVRGYVSTVFGCPYEGEVPLAAVRKVADALLGMGVDELVLSDTIGIAHPGQVRRVLADLRDDLPWSQVALHFHDTHGTALANVLVALEADIRTFDASAGGLGGCPFAPGAAGNLATEDLIYMLDGLGLSTGISLERVAAASTALAPHVGHPPPSSVWQAIAARSAPV
jgi:hydroxymethylglutaryl-CoA lyase